MDSSVCSCLTDSWMLGQAHVIIQTKQLQPDAALHRSHKIQKYKTEELVAMACM